LEDLEVQISLRQKPLSPVTIFSNINGQNLQMTLPFPIGQGVQGGHLKLARLTPSCPKIEQHR